MRQTPTIFISKDGISTFWFLLAAGAVIGSLIYVRSVVSQTTLRPQFIIMANPDVKLLDYERDPAKQDEMIQEQSRLLMASVFNRAPSGLDAPERCRKLLNDAANDWVRTELLEKQEEAFREGRMHQKVEFDTITLRRFPNSKGISASVSGQLIRTGIHETAGMFNEVWAVKADMLWFPNDSILESGRIPTICHRFTCREVPIASTLRRTEAGAPAGAAPVPATTTPDSPPN